jgi:hypothetical protein
MGLVLGVIIAIIVMVVITYKDMIVILFSPEESKETKLKAIFGIICITFALFIMVLKAINAI